MKAYYIHWNYGSSADDQLFYGGEDDSRLFHHKENAIKCADISLESFRKYSDYDEYCAIVSKSKGEWYDGHCPYLTPEEEDYYHNFYSPDVPDSYTILERDIVFEDEL